MFDLDDDLFFSGTIERRTAGKHDVQHYSDTPHVTLFSIVSGENFRSNVVRRAILLMHSVGTSIIMVRRTKINNFDLSSVPDVDENVFRFKISVSNILSMTICDGLQNLFSDMGSFILCQMLTLADLIE